MIKFLEIALLFLLPFSNLFSQKNVSTDFETPLNIPLFLSGNYGELRTGHFHAGIDFKTQGVTGKPVFAAYEGFIARIKIQSGGYGNALYIAHPNGYTTVYAHLDQFMPAIQEYVEKNQYEKQKFEIELFPRQDQFVVEKGQVVAYSGNSGRSGGPHLHFEIRKSNGQVPVNGLRFNFPVADNLHPVFRTLYVYNLKESLPVGNSGDTRRGYSVVKMNDTAFHVVDPVIISGNFFGLGIEAYDYLNGSSNRCGVYRMDYYFDGKFVYGFTIDAISFANTRYINAHMDYDLKSNEGKSVHRLYALPNNRLPVYSKSGNEGILALQDDSIHVVRVDAADVYGNRSVLHFTVRRDPDAENGEPTEDLERVRWFEGGIFQKGPYRVTLPPASLYNDIYFDLKHSDAGNLLEDTLFIHHSDEPLHKNMTIRVALDSNAVVMKEKLVFARIDEENTVVCEGGECIDSRLITSTRNFGKYFLLPDTTKPEIAPVTFVPGKTYTAGQSIKFKVLDELSGIHSYTASIDEQWVLFKYDAKSDIMEYTIDDSRLVSGKNHDIRIEVRDNKGNLGSFSGSFYY